MEAPDTMEEGEAGNLTSHQFLYTVDWLCGEGRALLDSRTMWNTQDPDLSVCLQKSLFVWIPCGLLWALAPLQGYWLLRSKGRLIPHSLLSVVKTILACGLLLLALTDLVYFATLQGEQATSLDIWEPLVRGSTWLLVVGLVQGERWRGCRNSPLLWAFWLVYLLTQAPRLYSQVRRQVQLGQQSTELASNSLTYLIVAVQWILSFFMDSQPSYTIGSASDESSNPSPETCSSFPSIITFSWFDSLAYTGYKRALEAGDLWQLNPRDQSSTVAPIFNRSWEPRLKAANLSSREQGEASFSAQGEGDVKVKPGSGSPARENLSVFRPLVVSFGLSFLGGSCLKFIHDMAVFIAPMLLRAIINYAGSPDTPVWRGIFYAVCLLLVTFMQTLLLSTYFYRMYLVGMWAKSALISAIYRKSLTVTAEAKKGSTSGEIVNLMSVDAQKITDMLPYLNMLWSSPLQIVVAIYLLYQILGASVIAGFVVMIILIPVNGISAAVTRKLQVKMMKQKDVRVKKMNELLSGMKILKLYAWEPSFMQEVVNIRNAELSILLNIAYLSAFISFFWTCAPFVVSLVTFAVYVLSDENNVLDAEKAFTSLALFNILRFPLSMLPMMITSAVQASVSVKRINKFMRSGELDTESVEKGDRSDQAGAAAITVTNASFNWGEHQVKEEKEQDKNGVVTNGTTHKAEVITNGTAVSHGASEETDKMINGEEPKRNGDTPTASVTKAPFSLTDISLVVPRGSLCAVVGTVGAGKSSLLSALLGEMERSGGTAELQGRVAYVSQQAWIQNARLKDNILFGAAEDEARYRAAIDDCALTSDLEILPANDQTEIGEKGINLSGGQKQRVALARAVYSDADLYLLDDPLSAVDSHVGKHIFDRVVGPEGCLRDKTRVLVTHAVTFLPQVDQIVVLKAGVVSEVGTYKELLERRGDFAEFLVQYLSTQGDQGELATIKKELEQQLSKEEVVQLEMRVRGDSESGGELGSNGSLHLGKEGSPKKAGSPLKAVKEEQVVEKKPQHQQYKEESSDTGSVDWRIYLIYYRSMGYALFSSCIFFYMVYQIFSTVASMWVAFWSDNQLPFEDASEHHNMTDTRRDIFLGVYGAAGFAQAIAAVLASLMLYLSTITAGRALHHRMLDRIMHCPMAFFDTTPQGRILNRFGKDVDVLDGSMPMILRGWITCLFSCVATFLVIMGTTPWAALPIALVLTGYYFVQRVYVASSRQLKRLESTSRSPIYSHFGETIAGASVIRAYGLQDRFIRESERRVDTNHQAAMAGIIGNRWLAVRLETVGNCIIFAAALFAVLGRDHLSPGMIGLSVSYALQVTQTLNWLVRMTSEVETNIVTVERLEEYSMVETEADWENGQEVEEAWPREGKIELKGYSTRYREGLDLVLRDIQATIQGGERVGIVGRTGAGKSSLTLALFRLIEPASGSILIDGVDISRLGLHRLRSRLTIIPQDPVLFSGTLRHNLDPFELYSDEAVWASLRQSHLAEFVSGLALGLQHEVSEGGENLSVGQRQLICLARALLRKTKVLVLDEATAAVDLETDDLIQATIRTEFAGCTIITIAHRLNTVLDYDRILVLKDGSIAELDSPKALLRKEGSIFRVMCQDAGLA